MLMSPQLKAIFEENIKETKVRHKLTTREQEIIDLVIKLLSGQEFEDKVEFLKAIRNKLEECALREGPQERNRLQGLIAVAMDDARKQATIFRQYEQYQRGMEQLSGNSWQVPFFINHLKGIHDYTPEQLSVLKRAYDWITRLPDVDENIIDKIAQCLEEDSGDCDFSYNASLPLRKAKYILEQESSYRL